MKKILITGSSGYIGQHLVKLLQENYGVYGIDNKECPNDLLTPENFMAIDIRYDIDDFLDYLVTHLISSKELLIQFEHIDRAITTLEIIVDNYTAGLVKKVLDSDDIKRDIRDLKLKKMIEND